MNIEPKKPSLLAPIPDVYEPTSADEERVLAKIQASLTQAAAAPTTVAAASRPGKLLLVGLSCVAIAIVGAVRIERRFDSAAPSAAGVGAPTLPAPIAVPPAPTPPAPPAPPLGPAPQRVADVASAAPSVVVDSLPSANAAPPVVRDGKKRAVAASPVEPAAPPPSDTLEREARLLGEARRALKGGDGAHALELLEEHARLFPNSYLASDRAAERINVLCSLGRRAEAVRDATVFLEGRPKSPLTRRVEMSCAGPR